MHGRSFLHVALVALCLCIGSDVAMGCPGDCSGDGAVTVNELVAAVDSALGLPGAASCAAADVDGDGTVTVDELIAAVGAARGGCPVDHDLTVADLNILHGLFCPQDADSCRLPDRIDLLFQWIAASGCPDIVTLQEVWPGAVPLIEAHLATICPFAYRMVFVPVLPPRGLDQEMILTRYPAITFDLQFLHPSYRHVLSARIRHPIGPIDIFSTHLASGSDNAEAPCGSACPTECVGAGAQTIRDCQAVQVATLAAARHDVDAPALITGDFNDAPGSFVYRQFVERGWIDTYLAAGNPECDPATGTGCTSGRADEDLSDLESTTSHEIERIDFIFLKAPGIGSTSCTATIDPASDDDGDGTATRIFADDPNPFAPMCGPAPLPICWPSDHEGAELDLNCL